jgi:hypothetical protein
MWSYLNLLLIREVGFFSQSKDLEIFILTDMYKRCQAAHLKDN